MNADHPMNGVAPEPGVHKPDPVLVAKDLQKSFGGLRAVDIDHLEIQRHTVTSLIGPNGAGKTTLFNLLTGFDKPDAGEWHLNGGGLVGIAAFQVARRGMVRTFQLTRSLARLTVMDNMLVAAKDHEGEGLWGSLTGGWHATERANEERASELLDRFGLDHMADEYAGSLSGGQRKLLEMARALMMEPEVVMLDEPMAGLTYNEKNELIETILKLKEQFDLSIILVEHDMKVIMNLCESIAVMNQGQLIAEGAREEIRTNPQVIEAYLGTSAT